MPGTATLVVERRSDPMVWQWGLRGAYLGAAGALGLLYSEHSRLVPTSPTLWRGAALAALLLLLTAEAVRQRSGSWSQGLAGAGMAALFLLGFFLAITRPAPEAGTLLLLATAVYAVLRLGLESGLLLLGIGIAAGGLLSGIDAGGPFLLGVLFAAFARPRPARWQIAALFAVGGVCAAAGLGGWFIPEMQLLPMVIAPWLLHFGSPRPWRWTAIAAVMALLWFRPVEGEDPRTAEAALALAAGLLLLAAPLARRLAREPDSAAARSALLPLVAAAVAAVAWVAPLAIQPRAPWLGALLMVPLLAWVGRRLPSPWLWISVAMAILAAVAGILKTAEGAESWERIQAAGECRQRGTTTTCLVRFPEREIQDLVVDVPTGDQDVGFRISNVSLGSWGRGLEIEGIWHAAPGSRHRIEPGGNTFYGGPIRLELTGAVRPPRLMGVEGEAGGPRYADSNDPGPAPKASRAVFPLEDAWFPAAWPVRAEGVRSGDTVRLELTPEVLGRLGRPYLWELRVVTLEGQLPWAFEIDELPRPEAERAAARWIPAERPGWLRLSLSGPKGPAYTAIHLTAPPRPLVRRVSVGGSESGWVCVPRPPLPCRFALDLAGMRELPEIEIEGGEGNPLPPVEVSVWRQTEYLVFVWPEQGPVRLLAGNGGVYGQDVTLGELDPRVTSAVASSPWKPVTLGPQERLFRNGYLGGAILSTLVLAGLCLWERRRRVAAPVLLLALLAAPARGEEAVLRSVLRERLAEVPAAGWVRVPLGLETLSAMGPDGERLQVIGPGGEEVPSEIEAGPDEAGERTVSLAPHCTRSGASALCSLRLPVRGQLLRGLTLELRDTERGVGIRVAAAREGRWERLAEEVWESPVEGERRLRRILSPASELLRLELYGESAPPRLVQAKAQLATASVLFPAPAEGTYRLVYGDGRAPRGSAGIRGEREPVREIEPGPERMLPPLPGVVVEPRISSRQLAVEASWPVLAPGARTGEVVRLLLPAEIGSEAGVRLQAGEEEIPYLLRTLDEPAREAAVRFPADEGERFLSLPIGSAADVAALRLETGTGEPVSVSMWGWGIGRPYWSCQPPKLLPCVLDLESPGKPSPDQVVGVGFHEGHPELTATVWRRQRELVFVWPGGRGLRLLAGRGEPATPAYDLLAIQDRLLVQPWKPAHVGRGGELPVTTGSRWLRWSLVALAALALLAVVHVMMPPETQKDRRIRRPS